MIRAIVFDMGGVLADLDKELCLRTFREELGYTQLEAMIGVSAQKGIFGEMELGVRSAEEFCDAILTGCREGARREDVVRCLETFITGVPREKTDLMERLALQYPLYFLSNNNPIAMAKIRRCFRENGFDWEKWIRKEFISCDMHLMKPGKEIFLAAIAEIGLPPEEILFIDDAQPNVDAAVALGLRAVRYEPGTDLEKLISEEL